MSKKGKLTKMSEKLYVGLFTHGSRELIRWGCFRVPMYPAEWHVSEKLKVFWNITSIIFPQANHDWPEIVGYGLFDLPSNCNSSELKDRSTLLALEKFDDPITVSEDDVLVLPAEALIFSLSTNIISL